MMVFCCKNGNWDQKRQNLHNFFSDERDHSPLWRFQPAEMEGFALVERKFKGYSSSGQARLSSFII